MYQFGRYKPLAKHMSTLLAVVFSLAVVVSWMHIHTPLLESLFLFAEGWRVPFNRLLPLVYVLALVLTSFSFLYILKRTLHIPIQYTLLSASLGYTLFIAFLFNITAYIRILYPLSEPTLNPSHILIHNTAFVGKILLQGGWILLFISATYMCGSLLLRYAHVHEVISSPLLSHLTAIALGMWMWTILIFVLGSVHMLSVVPILIVYILITVLYRPKPRLLVHSLTRPRSIVINIRSLTTWFILAAVFLLSLTLIDSLRPQPAGFDDMTEYLNRAHLMAQSDTIVPGDRPFSFGLLAAAAYTFGGNAMLAYGNNVAYALLGFLSVYGVSHFFTKSRVAALAAGVVWIYLPMTSEFLFRDIKPDLLLFFLTTLSFWLFLEWIEKKQSIKYLYLSFFLLGFALTVKINAIFMIIPIVLYVFTRQLTTHTKQPFTQKVLPVLFASCISLAPLVLWFGYAVATGGIHHMSRPTDVLSSYNNTTPTIDEQTWVAMGVDSTTCSFNGIENDLTRFSSEPLSVSNFAFLPWQITMNQRGAAPYYATETGFVFLITTIIFICIYLYTLIRRKGVWYSEKVFALAVSWVAYTTLWLFFGKNVLWYAYSGYVFASIMVALLFMYFKKQRVLLYLLAIVVFLNIGILAMIRTAHFAHPHTLTYIAESKNDYAAEYEPIVSILNTSSSTIYLIEGKTLYYIDNNISRVLHDPLLDTFTCINQETNNAQTLDRLRQLDIEYIVYNVNIPAAKNDPTGGLRTKSTLFLSFAQQELQIVTRTNDLILFSIPK